MGSPVKAVSWQNHSISSPILCMIACAISQVELNFPVTILIDLNTKKFFVKILKLNGVSFGITRPELRLFSTDVEDQYDIKGKTFDDLKNEFVSKSPFIVYS